MQQKEEVFIIGSSVHWRITTDSDTDEKPDPQKGSARRQNAPHAPLMRSHKYHNLAL